MVKQDISNLVFRLPVALVVFFLGVLVGRYLPHPDVQRPPAIPQRVYLCDPGKIYAELLAKSLGKGVTDVTHGNSKNIKGVLTSKIMSWFAGEPLQSISYEAQSYASTTVLNQSSNQLLKSLSKMGQVFLDQGFTLNKDNVPIDDGLLRLGYEKGDTKVLISAIRDYNAYEVLLACYEPH